MNASIDHFIKNMANHNIIAFNTIYNKADVEYITELYNHSNIVSVTSRDVSSSLHRLYDFHVKLNNSSSLFSKTYYERCESEDVQLLLTSIIEHLISFKSLKDDEYNFVSLHITDSFTSTSSPFNRRYKLSFNVSSKEDMYEITLYMTKEDKNIYKISISDLHKM